MNLTFKRFQDANAERALACYSQNPTNPLEPAADIITRAAVEAYLTTKQGRNVSTHASSEDMIHGLINYASLMASALDVDLETLMREKFSLRSEELRYTGRL